jgi:DNA polymerase-3 subunit epsilon
MSAMVVIPAESRPEVGRWASYPVASRDAGHVMGGWIGPPWHRGPLVGFDLETTGVDPTTARIVTASLVFLPPGRPVTACRSWLVDPGVEIPDEAATIHGITTERARAEGVPAGAAVGEILTAVDRTWQAGVPMVVFNAPYDLTVIDAEAARYAHLPLSARPGWRRAVILDPLVMDRRVDRYRRGRRTLQAAAEHYGIGAFDPHSSDADAAAACLVARAIAERFGWVARVAPPALHAVQGLWYRQWAARFQEYLFANGRPELVDGDWPVRCHRDTSSPVPADRRGDPDDC